MFCSYQGAPWKGPSPPPTDSTTLPYRGCLPTKSRLPSDGHRWPFSDGRASQRERTNHNGRGDEAARMAGFSALAALAAAILLPASADATTVTMGDRTVPLESNGGFGCFPCTPGETLAQSFTPDGEVNFAPASGLITSWHVSGLGTVKLS